MKKIIWIIFSHPTVRCIERLSINWRKKSRKKSYNERWRLVIETLFISIEVSLPQDFSTWYLYIMFINRNSLIALLTRIWASSLFS